MARSKLASDGTLLFHCPGCGSTHGVANGAVWTVNGSEERPTLSPSVLVRFGRDMAKVCHSFVRDGRIEFLTDCTHSLAGHTVDLPDWDEK
jgi:hypothetical protein